MLEVDRAAGVARALADPIRLAVLGRLLDGPAAVADLVAVAGESQPKVSNHLAVLRGHGLVRAERRGRQIVYQIANAAVAHLFESLSAASGGSARRPGPRTPIAIARSCYDHLAGSLGVSLFDALTESGAIVPPAEPRAEVALGPAAPAVFERLGVDPGRAVRGRRRYAFACLDWTERRFHLGGSLGAAIRDRFLDAGWITRDAATRTVDPTETGRQFLRETFGVELPRAAAEKP